MVTQNMVTGLPKFFPPNGVCRGCVLGKHHQEPFDFDKSWHAQHPLGILQNDLYCINNPSLEGDNYILTFINDLSDLLGSIS
jgi:hypothetical protein